MENIARFAHRRRRGFLGWVFGGLIFLIVIGAIVGPILFGYGYGMMGPYSYYYPHLFFGWFFFPFGFFVIFALFFAFRWLVFPWRGRYYYGRWHQHDGAEEILRERYAKGEITKDQFDQMTRDLEQKR
ncbi:MAG: SHOCT domain-containing protein [Nitrososphaerales archaeon]|nr:SHOCT domain-containing protein [Nitrososphaerales archaeon]